MERQALLGKGIPSEVRVAGGWPVAVNGSRMFYTADFRTVSGDVGGGNRGRRVGEVSVPLKMAELKASLDQGRQLSGCNYRPFASP